MKLVRIILVIQFFFESVKSECQYSGLSSSPPLSLPEKFIGEIEVITGVNNVV